jgi:hypothetical protein
MSGAERRREERVLESREKKQTKTRTEKENETPSASSVARASSRQPASVRANTSESTEKCRRSRPRFRRRLTGITYYSSLAVFAMMDERKARSTRPTLGVGRFLLAGGARANGATQKKKKNKKKTRLDA